ncbi:MAG: efflux RND transporter permease subunit [Nitrospira sp.]
MADPALSCRPGDIPRRPSLVVLAALVSLAVSGLLLWALPSELAPLEDTGWFAIHVNTPEESLDYGSLYQGHRDDGRTHSEMDSYYTVVARGWRPTLVTRAVTWVTLGLVDRDRAQREIVDEVEPACPAIPGASVFALNPPPFNQEDSKTPVQLVVRGPTYDVLDKIMTQVRHDTVNHPALVNVGNDLDLNKPELRVDISRDKAADLGIPVETIGRTLEVFLGGRKASMFMREGKGIIIQMRPQHRGTKSDIDRLHVRRTQEIDPQQPRLLEQKPSAPKQLNHYEKLRAATIPAPRSIPAPLSTDR